MKKNNFYIFVLIILFVVLVYFTNKEGIIFTRQVEVSSILYNSALDNTTKMKMIEKIDVAEPEYSNIIDKQKFCTGVSPYPSVDANGGLDCDNYRVEALKQLYSVPNAAYDTNVSIYAIAHDNTLDNASKISLFQQIPIAETNTDTLTSDFKDKMNGFTNCKSDPRAPPNSTHCHNIAINEIKNVYNP